MGRILLIRQQVLQEPILNAGNPPPANQLKFRTLSEFVGYLEPLSDNAFFRKNLTEFQSSTLLNAHCNKSSLFVDKYISCSIPDPQLEFLFESQGLFNYEAEFDFNNKFRHLICESEGKISEMFIANIRGDSYNPYIRFKSSNVCGSQQTSKLMDLAGLYRKDFSLPKVHDTVFNLLVLTFPEEISFLLLDSGIRDSIIKRIWKCYEKFFKQLPMVLLVEPLDILGSSVSLHLWSSEFPFLPHAHFHVVLPHFTYKRVSLQDRKDIEDIVKPVYDELSDVTDNLVYGSYRKVKSKQLGSMVDNTTGKPFTTKCITESKFKVTSVEDFDHYTNLKNQLSNDLGEYLGFEQLDWFGATPKGAEVPLDIETIKKLWSKIVYKEFDPEIGPIAESAIEPPDNLELLDVHTEFCKHTNKPKLLHYLQYKTRPAVLDLDLFLKNCQDFIIDYNDIDPQPVLQLLRSLFVNAAVKGDTIAYKYESLLQKAERFLFKFEKQDILDWLRFLSTWNTDTKVFGFWRYIKRYCLDPVNKPLLVKQTICPICGGTTTDVRFVDSIAVDSIIIRSRSKFLVFDIKGPPGGT